MERSGILNPTCCEIVPRARTTFENIDYNLAPHPAIANSLCYAHVPQSHVTQPHGCQSFGRVSACVALALVWLF